MTLLDYKKVNWMTLIWYQLAVTQFSTITGVQYPDADQGG